MSKLPDTHKAVRFYPPSYDVRVEYVSTPQIIHPDDAIVKIQLAGLCGSDLHAYRGLEPFDRPYTAGHEFVGEVVALGSSFSKTQVDRPLLYSTLQLGDKVVSPFTSSCEECRFCMIGFPSRCEHSVCFGCTRLEGGQAQYIRVPKAGGTLFKAPLGIKVESLLLCADILPTGYFCALQALQHPNMAPLLTSRPFPHSSMATTIAPQEGAIRSLREADMKIVIGVVGLGPVGQCAVISLLDLLQSKRCKHYTVVGVDGVESRRQKTQKMIEACGLERNNGTIKFVSLEEAKKTVDELTGGFGCDAVLEVVGSNDALQFSYDMIRPFGVISSVGVHTHPLFPLNGDALYTKNVSLSFGRCPVRSMFPFALEILERHEAVFGRVGGEAGFIERVVGIDHAPEAYKKFDSREWGKVLFDPFAQ